MAHLHTSQKCWHTVFPWIQHQLIHGTYLAHGHKNGKRLCVLCRMIHTGQFHELTQCERSAVMSTLKSYNKILSASSNYRSSPWLHCLGSECWPPTPDNDMFAESAHINVSRAASLKTDCASAATQGHRPLVCNCLPL